MRTLALDLVTGDLRLDAGSLVVVDGADALAQRIRCRVRLWLGEWFADTAIGVPWQQILGTKNAQSFAEATLRRVVATCPGVSHVDAFSFAFDGPRRAASVSFRVTATDGTVVEDGGFRVDAATVSGALPS